MIWVSQTQPVRRRVLILLKLQIGTNNIVTREVGITGALKFKNCHFTVTVAKENKRVRSVVGAISVLSTKTLTSTLNAIIYYCIRLVSLRIFQLGEALAQNPVEHPV
jgi:hypothetical protein